MKRKSVSGDEYWRQTGYFNVKLVEWTEKVFPEEIGLILENTNLMRRITAIHTDSKSPHLSAVMNLFARNRELVHFTMVCLMDGGYAPAKILLRVALENTLTLRLFNRKIFLAEEWFLNPGKFGETWTPQRTRDELFKRGSSMWNSYNEFYWSLCNYSHPSFKGWREFIGKGGIPWKPVFNEDYASECIGLVFFVIQHSLMQFGTAFMKWTPANLHRESTSLIRRNSLMVARHLRVVVWTGRKGKESDTDLPS